MIINEILFFALLDILLHTVQNSQIINRVIYFEHRPRQYTVSKRKHLCNPSRDMVRRRRHYNTITTNHVINTSLGFSTRAKWKTKGRTIKCLFFTHGTITAVSTNYKARAALEA